MAPAPASVLVAAEPVAVELGKEAERLHRPHAVEVDLPVQMVALVLHDARVESPRVEAERTAVPSVGLDPHPRPAWHLAAQVGNAEAALPVLFLILRERREARV